MHEYQLYAGLCVFIINILNIFIHPGLWKYFELHQYIQMKIGYLIWNNCAHSPHTVFSSELETARPQTVGEEELQLQLALAMSREEAEQEEQRRRSDDVRLQLALSQSEQEFK